MNLSSLKLPPDWTGFLVDPLHHPSMLELGDFLIQETASGRTLHPPSNEIFNAFYSTPLEKVKVVLLGQDPYHATGQAHGLSFSVKNGMRPPPSLQNIFKELKADLGFDIPPHGNLQAWAEQGVLLLNSVLTVRHQLPASHRGKGWEIFTDAVIEKLQAHKSHVVFLLWGKFAQSKAGLINQEQHLILRAAHPSPFSAHTGFMGCRHFSKTNQYLTENNIGTINWQLM